MQKTQKRRPLYFSPFEKCILRKEATTMTDEPIVVARIINTKDGNPRFTRATTINELMQELVKLLPVDTIYTLFPDRDGRGYSLREVGTITLKLIPYDQPEQSLVEAPKLQVAPKIEKPLEKTPVIKNNQPQTFEPGEFVFDTPKSQAELLRERGLEQAPLTALAGVKKVPKKVKKSKGDDDLLKPSAFDRRGKVQVTGIREATPEEAAAASMFGKL
jgi:hypothetical protein